VCGIVGYLGSRDGRQIVIDGLRRLEYRGYDSAGLAVNHDGTIDRCRAVGDDHHDPQAVGDDVVDLAGDS